VGIGGGAVSVPYLTLHGVPIQRAVGTTSAFGMLIAVPGVLGFIAAGWGGAGLPPLSLGYVNLLGLAIMMPAMVLVPPLGAKAAHKLDREVLRRIFGGFLVLVAGKMLWGLISP
jgi:uncharacterized membrane protein YfcA